MKALILLTMFFLISGFIFSSDIAVITAGGGLNYWGEVHKGANEAAHELGLELYARGPSDEKNVNGQNKAIDAAILDGCKFLILAPISETQLSLIKDLKSSGIPTIFIDRDIGGERLAVIKTNNYNMGRAAAIEMAKALNGKKNIAIFRMDKNVVTTTFRENGFIDAAKELGLNIVLEEYTGTTIGDSREKVKSILKNRNDIHGIFTPNESTTMGTIAARKDLNDSFTIIQIGIDLSPYLEKAIKDLYLFGTFIQNPYQIGYLSVKAAYSYLQWNHPIEDTESIVIKL